MVTYLVGVPGFEPGASWSRTKRDTKLRHTPKTTPTHYTCISNTCQVLKTQNLKKEADLAHKFEMEWLAQIILSLAQESPSSRLQMVTNSRCAKH